MSVRGIEDVDTYKGSINGDTLYKDVWFLSYNHLMVQMIDPSGDG